MFNEAFLKRKTGENVSARDLFSNDLKSFQITGKLFIGCNAIPPTENADSFAWRRRLYIIPFDSTFDKHVEEDDEV